MRISYECTNAEHQAEIYELLASDKAKNCKSLTIGSQSHGNYRIDVAHIIRILMFNKRLEKLIVNARMDNEYLWRILKSITNSKNLKELGLYGIPLDPYICGQIKAVLDTNKNLAILRLRGITLSSEVLNILGKSIQNSTSMVYLDLTDNCSLYNTNRLFDFIINNKSLQRWDVYFQSSYTGSTPDGIINLLNNNNTLLSLHAPVSFHAVNIGYLKRFREAVIKNDTIQNIKFARSDNSNLLSFDDDTGFSVQQCLDIRKAKNTTLANLCSKLITEQEIAIPEWYPKILVKLHKPLD